MSTIYACTHYDKDCSHWSPTEGASIERWTVDARPVDIQADTLERLIEKIARDFGLKLDSLFLPEDDGEVTWFEFGRVENNYGDEPTDRELELWEAGELELFLADYSFHVECRTVRPLTIDEFKAADLVTH